MLPASGANIFQHGHFASNFFLIFEEFFFNHLPPIIYKHLTALGPIRNSND
jgi:hypothetical protein